VLDAQRATEWSVERVRIEPHHPALGVEPVRDARVRATVGTLAPSGHAANLSARRLPQCDPRDIRTSSGDARTTWRTRVGGALVARDQPIVWAISHTWPSGSAKQAVR
jgi:hypothetical protein